MTNPDEQHATTSQLGRPDYHDDLIAAHNSDTEQVWHPKGSRSDPVTGWRVWGVYRDEDFLRGPFSAVPWRTGSASVACSQHGEHTTAHPRCREGIYLFTNEFDAYLQAAICYTLIKQRIATGMGSTAWSYMIGSLTATGIVNLHHNEGLLLEGGDEWITQKASIDKIYVLQDFCPNADASQLRDKLENSLRIPVKSAASNPQLAKLLDGIQNVVWTAIPQLPQSQEQTAFQRHVGYYRSNARSLGSAPIQPTAQWIAHTAQWGLGPRWQ